MNISKTVIDIINESKKKGTSAFDTQGKVVRVEGDTAWVHFAGGIDETPVRMTVNASVGDDVQVRVSGGDAFLVGNGSAPPTDDTTAFHAVATANTAIEDASRAKTAADNAVEDAARAADAAHRAETSANEAKVSAENANEYASRSLASLSTVQSVSETLTWITQHGTMTLTTDTQLDPTHVYFVLDPTGDYVVNNTHYSLVTEPNADDLSTYYELSIDESLNNYVGTHLALTGEGLWLLPATSGTNKVLIATGAGTTYTTPGTYIINSTGGVEASFRSNGATVGQALNGYSRTEIGTNGMRIVQRESGSDTQIAQLGYDLGTAESGTAIAPYYTFGTRASNSTLGNYSVAEGYETTASGYTAHAEGWNTQASEKYSHAEGWSTKATMRGSHAEGYGTEANESEAHAEGSLTKANGKSAHAEGSGSEANGDNSHAGGLSTIANGDNQTVIGKYNAADTTSLFIIGKGSAAYLRSNALIVDSSGNVRASGDIYLRCNSDSTGGSKVISSSDVTTDGEAGKIPQIKSSGVLELRKYIDMHDTNSTYDYDVRIAVTQGTAAGKGTINFGCDTFNIHGSTLADFVVEQGTSGIWTYRKWYSGIAECWGTTASASRAMTSPYAGWYYANVPAVSLPSGLFKSVTYANGQRSGGTQSSGLVSVSVYAVSTTEISSYIYTGQSSTIDVAVSYEVRGQWK